MVCEVNHINVVIDDKKVEVFASIQANDEVEQYNWKFSDGFSEASINPWVSHTIIQDGNYVVELQVDLDHGNSCVFTETFEVDHATINTDTCDINIVKWELSGLDLEVEVEIDGNPSDVDVYWDFGDGSAKILGDEEADYQYLNNGTYNVTIEYAIPYGCSDSTNRIIVID